MQKTRRGHPNQKRCYVLFGQIPQKKEGENVIKQSKQFLFGYCKVSDNNEWQACTFIIKISLSQEPFQCTKSYLFFPFLSFWGSSFFHSILHILHLVYIDNPFLLYVVSFLQSYVQCFAPIVYDSQIDGSLFASAACSARLHFLP